MGRGRGRARSAVVGAFALAALAVAGCGTESHPNEPRPAAPTRVSVTLGANGVTVSPSRVAFGPERTQQIPQNQNHPQPPIKGDRSPLNVVFVIANQTDHPAGLRIHGARDVNAPQVPPGSPGTFQTELPAGSYRITAAGIPAAANELTIGPYRASSENDVLLP